MSASVEVLNNSRIEVRNLAAAECEKIYIAISKNVVRENDECQLSNGDCTTEKKCGY